jgi:hypothetical protein
MPEGAKASSGLYHLTASLGYNFIAGGQLRLALVPANERPEDVCQHFSSRFHFGGHPRCITGVNTASNEHTLSTVVTAPASTTAAGAGAGVGGVYTLWLVELIGRRVPLDPRQPTTTNEIQCTPFDLKIDLRAVPQHETYLSCDLELLPTTFNEPGLLSASNRRLHFKQHALINLDTPRQAIPFTLDEDSLLKVTAFAQRVDVDINIVSTDTNPPRTIASSSRAAGQTDIIEVKIPRGKYALNVIYFGSYDRRFCEGFDLELEILPLAASIAANSVCQTDPSYSRTILPNLSGMQTALHTAPYRFTLERTDYNLLLNMSDRSTLEVLSHTFTVAQESWLDVHLGTDFLLGDLGFSMQATGVNGTVTVLPSNRWLSRNSHVFRTSLRPGVTYRLVVRRWEDRPGGGASSYSSRPSCLPFSFALSVVPYTSSLETCKKYRSLPASLNTAEFLGLADDMHIQEEFLMPKRELLVTGNHNIQFTVRTESYMRAVTRSKSTIYFYLKENGVEVKQGIRSPTEDETRITYRLHPGREYVLRVYVYYDSLFPSVACETFNFEMAISPVAGPLHPIFRQCDGGNVLPSANNNPLLSFADLTVPSEDDPTPPTSSYEYIEQTYQFTQTAQPMSTEVNFELKSEGWFRAQVQYDFAWGDIGFVVLQQPAAGSGGQPRIIIASENRYDKDEAAPQLLPAGQYTLRLFETSVQEVVEWRRCIHFQLGAGVQLLARSSLAVPTLIGESACARLKPTLPSTFNSFAYMSEFSDNQFHINADFWLGYDKRTGSSHVIPFIVTTTSYLRIFVAPHSVVDVDVIVRDSARRAIDGMMGLGVREEMIFGLLPPGTYYVQFRFYSQVGQRFPRAGDCVGIPMQMALIDRAHMERYLPPVQQPAQCAPAQPDTTPLALDSSASLAYVRFVNQSDPVRVASGAPRTPYKRVMTFDIPEARTMMEFDMDIQFSFAEGPLFFQLTGELFGDKYPGGRTRKTYYPRVVRDRVFLSTELEPGKYTLEVRDPTQASPSTGVDPSTITLKQWCSGYTLQYALKAGGSNSICDTAITLPVDLFTEDGGSQILGGPQNAQTGEVRISSDRILLPPRGSQSFIEFKIVQESYVRIWTRSHPEDDIDYLLFDNANLTNLIDWSLGSSEVESKVIRLPPQPVPYVLELHVFKRRDEEICAYFEFEMAIETDATVATEFQCPAQPPALPPSPVVLPASAKDPIRHVRSRHVLTKPWLDANHRTDAAGRTVATLPITVNVQAQYDLYVQVGFDFIATDFFMTLSRADGSGPVATSKSSSPGWSKTDAFNFASTLRAHVAPGQYFLNVTNVFHDLPTRPAVYCHAFTYELVAYIDSVSPPVAPTPAPIGISPVGPAPTPVPVGLAPKAGPVPSPPPPPPPPTAPTPNPTSSPSPNPTPIPSPAGEAPSDEKRVWYTDAKSWAVIAVVLLILGGGAGAFFWWWRRRAGGRRGVSVEQYVPLVQMNDDDDDNNEDFFAQQEDAEEREDEKL